MNAEEIRREAKMNAVGSGGLVNAVHDLVNSNQVAAITKYKHPAAYVVPAGLFEQLLKRLP